MNQDEVISALRAGTAESEDVARALGWKVIDHKRMYRARLRNGHCESLPRVTSSVDDALFLIDRGHQHLAIQSAMSLTEIKSDRFGTDIARRVCIVALTRPDLRSKYATEGNPA